MKDKISYKRVDFYIFILLLGITAIIWYYFNLKALYGFLLYTIIPSGYLVLREKKNYFKLSLAVLIFGLLMGFIFDTIQTINNTWVVNLVLPWKILNIEPIDNLIGYALMTLLIVVFYEHFLDDEKDKRISKNFIYFFLFLSVLIIVFYTLLVNNPEFFKFQYSYATLGLLAIIVPILLAFYKPKLIPKILMMASVFYGIWLVNEIVALKTGGWIFPGEYIGLVTIFGVTFPFEEIFFWMMWYAATITAFYELFLDDLK